MNIIDGVVEKVVFSGETGNMIIVQMMVPY